MSEINLKNLRGLRVGPYGVALVSPGGTLVRTAQGDSLYEVQTVSEFPARASELTYYHSTYTGGAIMERWPYAIPEDVGWEMLMLLAGGKPSPIAAELSEADRERLKFKVQAIREAGSRMLAYAADLASALELPAPAVGISWDPIDPKTLAPAVGVP